jgi:hypothetical protein
MADKLTGCLMEHILERRGKDLNMVAYEFYWRNPLKGYELLGVLPERRKNLGRITEPSVINWVRKFFGKSLDIEGIFIHQVRIDGKTGKTFRSASL